MKISLQIPLRKILSTTIGNILQPGGWSSEKTFAKYYNKPHPTLNCFECFIRGIVMI